MMKKKADDAGGPLEVHVLARETITFCILGESPLICNAMSFKSKRGLLAPERVSRRTKAERAAAPKHNPLEEYRDSVYARRGNDGPTRLLLPSTAFKGALMSASTDLPNVRKAQIGRLVWVDGAYVDLYGIPQIYMAVVRNSDINHTPDVRTRALVENWACRITVSHTVPHVPRTAVGNLTINSGMIIGVGDFRQEKGKGSFGRFTIVPPTNQQFLAIVKHGGMKAQDAALRDPTPYDFETERMLSWLKTPVVNIADARATKKRKEAA